jgi:hypothetical protein
MRALRPAGRELQREVVLAPASDGQLVEVAPAARDHVLEAVLGIRLLGDAGAGGEQDERLDLLRVRRREARRRTR